MAPPVADRLRLLVTSSPSTSDEIAAAARANGQSTLTTARLHRLTTGSALPTADELDALAHVLAIDPHYFATTDRTEIAIIDAVVVLAAAARHRGLQLIGPCRHRTLRPTDYLALLSSLLSATTTRGEGS